MPPDVRSQRLRWALLCGYVCLIVYVTLYPFSGWRGAVGGWWLFSPATYHDISGSDTLANVLLYVPVGFLLGLRRRLRALPLVLLAALVLSLGLETTQAFIPGRVSSLLDVLVNVFGAGLGVVIAPMLRWPAIALGHAAMARLRDDRIAWVGIAALAAWACAQLIPFLPSLDVSNLKQGLKPLWYALHGRESVSLWRTLVYAAATALLTVSGASALRVSRWAGVAGVCLLAVLPLKVLVIGRQLSPEALVGTLVGVAVGIALWRFGSRRAALVLAAILVPVYIVAEALQPGPAGSMVHLFNWIPLHAQLTQPINGSANLADSVWPLLALFCVCRRLGVRAVWPLLPLVGVFLFAVQWAQCWVPGRYPDITTVLAGMVAWAIAAAWVGTKTQPDNGAG